MRERRKVPCETHTLAQTNQRARNQLADRKIRKSIAHTANSIRTRDTRNARNDPDYPLIFFLIETLVSSRRSYDSHKTDASTKPLRKEIRPPTPLLNYRYATSELTSAASGKAVGTQAKHTHTHRHAHTHTHTADPHGV